MDFEFNADQEAWRNEIRGWIREEFGEAWNGLDVSNDEEGSDEAWEFSKGIRTKLAEKGWTAPAWPTEHGGMACRSPSRRSSTKNWLITACPVRT